MMEEKVLYGKLVAKRNDVGGYTVYVFENFNYSTIFNQYIMCTRFPNWECPILNIGDIGYVKYREVLGGVDEWYDRFTDTKIKYKYTGIHFLNFVFDEEKQKDLLI